MIALFLLEKFHLPLHSLFQKLIDLVISACCDNFHVGEVEL